MSSEGSLRGSPQGSPQGSPRKDPHQGAPQGPSRKGPSPTGLFRRLVWRNAQRTRRENLVYFVTLVVSIASFYLIFSLSHQDLVIFLRDFESDAIDKLLALMPVVYGLALGVLFFLVLFANGHQLARRSREFGVYLMFGMSKRRAVLQLLAEGLVSGGLALVAGLALGSILGELLSLVTSRLIGQGIIGHHLSISLEAYGWTALGFAAVQALALLVHGRRLFRCELFTLLQGQPEIRQKAGTGRSNIAALVAGVASLVAAAVVVPRDFSTLSLGRTALALALCIAGIFLCVKGATRLLSLLALRSQHSSRGLTLFNLRQLQEGIANRSAAVTAAAVLMTLMIICAAAGTSVIGGAQGGLNGGDKVYHFTVVADEAPNPDVSAWMQENPDEAVPDSLIVADTDAQNARIEEALTAQDMTSYVADLNALRIGSLHDGEHGLDWSRLRASMVEALAGQGIDDYHREGEGYSTDGDTSMLEHMYLTFDSSFNYGFSYLIPVSAYNRVLETAGRSPLDLGDAQAALYVNTGYRTEGGGADAAGVGATAADGAAGADGSASPAAAARAAATVDFASPDAGAVLDALIARAQSGGEAALQIDGKPLSLVATPSSENLVADRSITITTALIVPDELFDELASATSTTTYWNFRIPEATQKEQGLMPAIQQASERLSAADLHFENYLQNFGRTLFYVVAGSYSFIYMALLFLLISCTVLAIQFLTQAQATLRRYLTLTVLGARRASLNTSVRVQVAAYFLIPLVLACVCGSVGVQALGATIGDLAVTPSSVLAAILVVSAILGLYALTVARSVRQAIDSLEYERVD
ncbi:MAG: ABC transporter permease [Coriobacteriales bacterium]|jgi:putative ABC transport system permease protein|nr:ABC transporter permease [Coriobacteriales bacterium]